MDLNRRSWRRVLAGFVTFGIVVVASTSFARHGEEDILSNRIPEPAPYVVEETGAGGVPAPHQGQPFERYWSSNSTGVGGCTGCHSTLVEEWSGSMMSNAWRDPGWRGAFLLVARATSTDGDADIPNPPDGSTKASLNPFAVGNTSVYNVDPSTGLPFPGVSAATYSGSGSLMDDFCSRCHMPANYVDATSTVTADPPSGQEHGRISPSFDPTSTGTATAVDPFTGSPALESFGERTYDGNRVANSNSGRLGIQCEVCHTNVATRYTPYHIYNKTAQAGEAEYFPAPDSGPRDGAANGLASYQQDLLDVPDSASPNLGYGIGAGAFRLSPHALDNLERWGPFAHNEPCTSVNADPSTSLVCSGGQVLDPYLGGVFGINVPILLEQTKKHDGYASVKFERSEFCGACHDVTNPMTIKNPVGKWVGGFPIERTYTEFRNSRYADRPNNPFFDPNFKRDCMTCHMQQDYGSPATALTLYDADASNGQWNVPLTEPSCDSIDHNPGYSHHFVGGNSYMPRLIGAALGGQGAAAYPELLETSFSSADPASRFHYARYANPSPNPGNRTHHERMVWDRMRNVLTMDLTAPATATAGSSVNVTVSATNDGSGHNFPTGFPEGRAAWIRITAVDTNGNTDPNDDVTIFSQGDLTAMDLVDNINYPANCPDAEGHPTGWLLPAGSIDPAAYAMRAMASVDGVCPTLDLPYATPVNLVTNVDGLPIDGSGVVIDRNNPTGIPRYGPDPNDPEQFRGAFLYDTRLGPQRANDSGPGGTNPYATATRTVSIPIPSNAVGPIAVTGAVYYQAFEGIVARKFLGNLANTDDLDADEGLPGGSPTLEPCVLNGACDRENKPGARGEAELREAMKFDPVVVEGAPPLPMEVRSASIRLAADTQAPSVVINNSTAATNIVSEPIPANRHWSPSPYGGPTGNFSAEGVGETNVDPYRIAKVTFSEPVQGVDASNLYLTTASGTAVNAFMDQIDDNTYALFPYVAGYAGGVTLSTSTTYVIHVGSGITDMAGNALPPGPDAGEYTFGFTVGTNVPVDPNEVPLGGGGTPPNAPTNLNATDAGTGGAINLTWTVSTSGDVTQQDLKRSTSSGGPYSVVATFMDNTTSSYPDSGLTNGTPYYYVVTATNAVGESPNSNEASATPSGPGGGETAPSVIAVDPADGAKSVPRTTPVTVTFSEPVTVTSTGITLHEAAGSGGNPCGTLGASVSGTVGGSSSVWTFTPSGLLGSRVNYCVTVVATEVSDDDTDDPPDNMAADFVSTFKTAN